MSEKALRWIINIAGIVCLYAFLSVRILPMFNAVLLEKYIPEYWENTEWGELYYFNFIKHFREKGLPEHDVKYRFTDRHPQLNQADILCFGDSFFDFSRMETFPEQLADSLDAKVFYARFDRPLEYLSENNYDTSEKRFMIYETAERFLHDRFFEPQPIKSNDTRSGVRRKAAAVRDWIFLEDAELLYSQLLNRSYFTTHAYSAINTQKFNWFGHITAVTPEYTLEYERPWLFAGTQIGDTPRSFYYQHTEEEIENYCSNIELLAKRLEELYNIKMVFMIVPSKYTIYHTLLNNDAYNNFIPRMYSELTARDIPVINFLPEYLEHRDEELLYYGTDTHWTEEGLHIALEETLNVFDSLYSVNSNYASINYISTNSDLNE